MQYPYASLGLLQEIGALRESWDIDLIWDYLEVPKSHRRYGLSKEYDLTFYSKKVDWEYGRSLHQDQGPCLLVRCCQGQTASYLPDSHYYV